MAWIEPKTDWTKDTYVVTDTENAYNRIIGNINFLKNFAEELFKAFDTLDMGEEKTYHHLHI